MTKEDVTFLVPLTVDEIEGVCRGLRAQAQSAYQHAGRALQESGIRKMPVALQWIKEGDQLLKRADYLAGFADGKGDGTNGKDQ